MGLSTPMGRARVVDTLAPGYVHRELPIGWGASEFARLRASFQPYVRWIEEFLASGTELPSHIPASGSIAVPIGESTTPDALFAVLGEGVRFEVKEYGEYWITVHYPNPEPVVTLLPKVLPGTPPELDALCAACTRALGTTVGGVGHTFLAWLLPRFSWAMHTDHDNKYEQVSARVHVPLITNPQALSVWGRRAPDGREDWVVQKHLPAGRAHYFRVDVPHTVVNGHPTEPRLHLILDVEEPRD